LELSPARRRRWEALRVVRYRDASSGSISWTVELVRSSQRRSSSSVSAPRRATMTRFGGSPSSPSFRKTPSKLRPSGSARSKKNRMPGRG
jgi:hypothetical protein